MTRMSTRSATPASSARCARALGLRLGQRDAGDVHAVLAAAWIAKLPQPQPTSSTRSPGLQPSFVQTSSSLVSCASSSVSAPREKIAQE